MFMLQVMGIQSELGWAGCVAVEQDPQRVSGACLAARCRRGRTSAWGQLPQGGCSGCRSVVSVALDAPGKRQTARWADRRLPAASQPSG